MQDGAFVSVRGTDIKTNYSGVRDENGNVVLDFSDGGGGLSVGASTVYLNDVLFENNYTLRLNQGVYLGSAIDIDSGVVTAEWCVFVGNGIRVSPFGTFNNGPNNTGVNYE